jgi:ABC-2 type transport system ATP-binding protein
MRTEVTPFRLDPLEVRGASNLLNSTIPSRKSGRKETEVVYAEGIGKRYGDRWALRNLDLSVSPGTVLGLLGHNGAGKTTAIKILTTLVRPTDGVARIDGKDVVSEAAAVRRQIGVVGQFATVDELLSPRANLEMVGRLCHLSRSDSRRRAVELLERVGLSPEADKIVQSLSGGMRRRVDLAASLISEPSVLFLDEPTTGLDPESRLQLWEILRERVDGGTALILTTQYLEEADRLADRIVVLDQGEVAAAGSPTELKRHAAEVWLDVTLPNSEDLEIAEAVLSRISQNPSAVQRTGGSVISVPISPTLRLIEAVRTLDDEGIEVSDIHRRTPTLEDVFFALQGRANKGGSDVLN